MAAKLDKPASNRGAQILPFPAHEGVNDLLFDRLRGSDSRLTRQAIADWADPLDVAILAALLLNRPGAEIRECEEAAGRAGHAREAAFWHEAGILLMAITTPTGERC